MPLMAAKIDTSQRTYRQTILVLDIQFIIIRSIKISKYDLFTYKILLTKEEPRA